LKERGLKREKWRRRTVKTEVPFVKTKHPERKREKRT